MTPLESLCCIVHPANTLQNDVSQELWLWLNFDQGRQFFKSVYDFKFLMEAASIGVDLLNQPVARASIRCRIRVRTNVST